MREPLKRKGTRQLIKKRKGTHQKTYNIKNHDKLDET